MGIFGAIKNAIFGHANAATSAAQEAGAAMPQMGNQPQGQRWAQGQAPVVDVEAVLNGISQQKGNPDLNWRSSIVDLMKLLDLDSSLENRRELATELGYSGAKDGSAEMNIWLHRRVMEELEKNGGRVPAGLKD
jgi:hypothetical protein